MYLKEIDIHNCNYDVRGGTQYNELYRDAMLIITTIITIKIAKTTIITITRGDITMWCGMCICNCAGLSDPTFSNIE